jgi:ABC-type multidrug transport system permease subunit
VSRLGDFGIRNRAPPVNTPTGTSSSSFLPGSQLPAGSVPPKARLNPSYWGANAVLRFDPLDLGIRAFLLADRYTALSELPNSVPIGSSC